MESPDIVLAGTKDLLPILIWMAIMGIPILRKILAAGAGKKGAAGAQGSTRATIESRATEMRRRVREALEEAAAPEFDERFAGPTVVAAEQPFEDTFEPFADEFEEPEAVFVATPPPAPRVSVFEHHSAAETTTNRASRRGRRVARGGWADAIVRAEILGTPVSLRRPGAPGEPMGLF